MLKKVKVTGPLPRLVNIPDLAIGDPVTGGGANRILFQDADGALASDAKLRMVALSAFSNGVILSNGLGSEAYFITYWDGAAGGAQVGVTGVKAGETESGCQFVAVPGGDARHDFYVDDYNIEVTMGLDQSTSKFTLSWHYNLGTANVFTANGTTFEVVDALKLNNTVAAGAPGATTAKMSINVGGTEYYIALTAV